MFTRLITTILILAALAAGGFAAEPSAVELNNGKTLTGFLRPVSEGLYLLQTDEALYELSGGEIASVDGREGAPRVDGKRKFARTSSYRRLLPDGDVVISQSMIVHNRGRKIQSTVKWGAAPHELEAYETMTALDVYGHELEHRFEPRRGTDIMNVIVDLEVPVMPGEEMTMMVRMTWDGAAVLEDGVWTYTHWGDYAEDRLQNLKVELPPGAEVLSVNPPVRVVEHEGQSLVHWRRYYPKGEVFPLTVSYRLGD